MELKDYKQIERYRVLIDYYIKEEDKNLKNLVLICSSVDKKEDSVMLQYKNNRNNYSYAWFNKSDVQLVTNVIKDKYEIGIGDTVVDIYYDNEWVVYDYIIYGDDWVVLCYRKDLEPFQKCGSNRKMNIKKVIPLKPLTTDPIKKAIRVLEEAGVIFNGKIIKQ